MLKQDAERLFQIREELDQLAAKNAGSLTAGEVYSDNRLSGRLLTEAFEIVITDSMSEHKRAILLAGRKIFS